MTEEGRKIQFLLDQLSKLYEQIAPCLKTSNSLMKLEGWGLASTNVFGGLTYTVATPQGWIPRSFFSLYTNKKIPHISAFTSVVLGERKKTLNPMEPLLAAGWFDSGPGEQIGKRFNYDWPLWHLNMPERNDEGKLLSADARTFWAKEKAPFSRVSTIGFPLTSITSGDEFRIKLLKPLLQGIEITHQR